MVAKKKSPNPRTIPPDKSQVNFNVDAELLEKVNAIAFRESVNKTELFTLALQKFVELYEDKNGKINLPKNKGEGLKNL